MPKGVYDRGIKGRWAKAVEVPSIQPIENNQVDTRMASIGMNTAIVDKQPELQKANANVAPVLQTHGDDEVSTTSRLFGDDEVEQEAVQDPLREPIPEPVQKTEQPKEPISTEEPAPGKPNAQIEGDDFIDWDNLSGKKIRQKVDGKEMVITAEELKKYSDQDQIKKHLAQEADKVGDARRQLAEERKQLMEMRQQRAQQYEAPIPQNGAGTYQQPLSQQAPVDPVMARIQYLESQIQQMATSTAPVIFQSNRMALDNSLKARGFNDFNDYWPKVVANVTPQLIQELNGNEMRAAEMTYFQLKAQDMASAPKAPVNVPRRVEPVQAVPATQIDGGSSASVPINDDGGHQYRQAFRRATSLGDDKEAWNDVLRQKGILPE